jgi:hypothetical protein
MAIFGGTDRLAQTTYGLEEGRASDPMGRTVQVSKYP